MVLDEIRKGFRAVTTPFAYLMSGFDSKATENWVRGSDNPYETNGVSKSWNKLAKLIDSGLLDKALANLEKTGDSDGIEKIAELKQNHEENIKDWIKRIGNASAEEKARIMDEIVSTTKSEQAAVNKILGDSNKKLEQRNLKAVEEAEEARKEGDNKKYAEYLAIIENQQKEIHQGNLLKEHINKKTKEDAKLAKELEQQIKANQTWYSDINWGSWQVWLVVISFLAFGYLIYRTLMWVYENYLASWLTKKE